jgi:hypothetical protein
VGPAKHRTGPPSGQDDERGGGVEQLDGQGDGLADPDGRQALPHHLLDRLVEDVRIAEGPFHQRQLVDRPEYLGRRQRHLALRHRQLRQAVAPHHVHGALPGVVGVDVDERRDGLAPRFEDIGHRVALAPHEPVPVHPVLVEHPGQVAPARVGDQHHHQVVGPEVAPDLEGGGHRGAARPADEQPLLAGDAPRHEEAVLVGDGHHAVDQRGVVRGGPEVFADALDQVGPTRPARVHRAGGVGAHDLDPGALGLEVATDAGDGAAGADPGDEVRDPARGLPPDLGARRLLVGPRVPVVAVLVGPEGAGRLGHQPLGHRVVRLRVVGLDGHRAHDDPGAVRLEQVDLLGGHLVGDHEDAVVAPLCGDDGEAHARVARRGLDDRPARLQQAGALGLGDHGEGGAVLHAAAGVQHLELDRDRAGQPLGHPVQPQQRRVPDEVDERVGDLRRCRRIGHGASRVGWKRLRH